MNKRVISVFSLAMINIIAIDSIRTLPLSASYGLSAVFYYIVAALFFFVPTALVSAELATGWPQNGGIYIWVREALGKKAGFVTIWLQWFYNICWYPTIMSLIAATLAYCINPALAHDKWYMLTVIMVVFWSATLVNCLGLRASSLLSSVCAILGTIIPMLFIIALGFIWQVKGNPVHVNFSWKGFFPDLSSVKNMVFLTAILYGFVGIEMSAVHAGEVKNPQRDYPRAVFWSTLIIVLTLVLGSLAISLVIPTHKLNIITGLLQAFQTFFSAFGMSWMLPVIAILMVCGAIGGASAWMLGPSKGLGIAARDGSLPKWMSKTNKKNSPIAVLLVQGVIFTLLCSVFLLMPSVSSSFWVLTDITAILSLLVYIFMFVSIIVLRYKFPKVKRTFVIPGGKFGLWLTCGSGLLMCVMVIVIGFIPPSLVNVGSTLVYELILAGGVLLGIALPLFIYWYSQNRRSLSGLS